ncbi:MAG TPA: hypothetical protein VFW94_07815 [Candidatus Acidoferrales bacterium]|nr:hypothetical protein [Candidatus Acidoferrales bacterium]
MLREPHEASRWGNKLNAVEKDNSLWNQMKSDAVNVLTGEGPGPSPAYLFSDGSILYADLSWKPTVRKVFLAEFDCTVEVGSCDLRSPVVRDALKNSAVDEDELEASCMMDEMGEARLNKRC